jgi:hypothetical protein
MNCSVPKKNCFVATDGTVFSRHPRNDERKKDATSLECSGPRWSSATRPSSAATVSPWNPCLASDHQIVKKMHRQASVHAVSGANLNAILSFNLQHCHSWSLVNGSYSNAKQAGGVHASLHMMQLFGHLSRRRYQL